MAKKIAAVMAVFTTDFSSALLSSMPATRIRCSELRAESTLERATNLFVDAPAMLTKQGFPLSEEELLSKAKAYLGEDFESQGKWMDDEDFTFLGPVVGPLGKDAYIKAIASFDVYKLFPDINPNYYGLSVDPFDPGRVWAISRGTGSDPEKGKSFEAPPQAVSVTFNDAGKVTKFTIGHVMDRSVGNTGGLGGLFGPLYAVGRGLPFREAQPFKPSKTYALFNFVGSLASKFSKKK